MRVDAVGVKTTAGHGAQEAPVAVPERAGAAMAANCEPCLNKIVPDLIEAGVVKIQNTPTLQAVHMMVLLDVRIEAAGATVFSAEVVQQMEGVLFGVTDHSCLSGDAVQQIFESARRWIRLHGPLRVGSPAGC